MFVHMYLLGIPTLRDMAQNLRPRLPSYTRQLDGFEDFLKVPVAFFLEELFKGCLQISN